MCQPSAIRPAVCRRSCVTLGRETPRLLEGRVFVATDGFEYDGRVVQELLPSVSVHGRVIKEWGQNRVRRITRTIVYGKASDLDEALPWSEDSEELNTSFIEWLNLTIRRASSYLQRRTPCHCRRPERLAGQLELLRCHYNFMRPHRSLKFGKVMKTPAMQAGLASRRLTFRMVFMAGAGFLGLVLVLVDFGGQTGRKAALQMAA